MPADIVVPEKPAMPNVPPLAAIAVAQFVVGLLAAFGLDVSEQLQAAILQGSTAALIILPLAEAWLRGRRATAYATVHAAAVGAQATIAAAELAPVAPPAAVVQNAPAASAATINTGGGDAPGMPSTTPPTPAEQVPVGGAPMIDVSPIDRPYTEDDADADDREAEAGVSDANRDVKKQPDPGDPDEPTPPGDGEHPVTPSAAG